MESSTSYRDVGWANMWHPRCGDYREVAGSLTCLYHGDRFGNLRLVGGLVKLAAAYPQRVARWWEPTTPHHDRGARSVGDEARLVADRASRKKHIRYQRLNGSPHSPNPITVRH